MTVTPTSISCSSSGNKAFLEDIDGGMEWAEETNNLTIFTKISENDWV